MLGLGTGAAMVGKKAYDKFSGKNEYDDYIKATRGKARSVPIEERRGVYEGCIGNKPDYNDINETLIDMGATPQDIEYINKQMLQKKQIPMFDDTKVQY